MATAGAVPKYKIVFLGNQNTGKTALITQYMYDAVDLVTPTIGIDFLSKRHVYESKPVLLQLWDTAGQERFRSLIPSYIRRSDVAVIVYDISDRPSFETVGRWIDDVRAECGDSVIIFVVGNKADLDSGDRSSVRMVVSDDGRAKATEMNAFFCETSAKTAMGVDHLFTTIVRRLVERDRKTNPPPVDVEIVNIQSRPAVQEGPWSSWLCST